MVKRIAQDEGDDEEHVGVVGQDDALFVPFGVAGHSGQTPVAGRNTRPAPNRMVRTEYTHQTTHTNVIRVSVSALTESLINSHGLKGPIYCNRG